MRFTDNQSLDTASMANLDILAGTDVSSGTDKKFTLANLASWFLGQFNGLSLGGSARTVKTAIDALQTDVDKKADADGEYDDLVVGTSKQLLSDSYTEDFTPYKFRRSPHTDRLSESIVGCSVAWNQLVQNVNVASAVYGITRTKITGDKLGLHYSGTSTNSTYFTAVQFAVVSGHKYFFTLGATLPTGCRINISSTDKTSEALYSAANTATVYFGMVITNGTTVDLDTYPQAFDLTAMFGSAVADALYAMGDEGVKLFRSWYPNDYYPYTEATLEHVSGLEAHDMVGFNQWDEEWELGWIDNTGANRDSANIIRSKNYIPVFPSTSYYFKTPQTATMLFYDENKSCLGNADANGLTDITGGGAIRTTPSNCYYVRIWVRNSTTYNHDICINLSDPTRNGQYKPYEKHSYALDASLTLRGLIKYDETKGFYAVGDVYKANGTVARKYGIRAYQSGDESNTAVLTDGTNTVYELATPTTEEAEPFEAMQITDGTEEYVTDCLVPVGHESKYYENLRSKIEGLPTDFSAIICATEATNKASKNYAVGDYLIYNNTLYKVTTAIAADATLTVGTNITATTIMAEIKALQ